MRTSNLKQELEFLNSESTYLAILVQNKLSNKNKKSLDHYLQLRSKAIVQLNNTRSALISEDIKNEMTREILEFIDQVNGEIKKVLNIKY